MIPTNVDYAWAAGFLDGHAHFSVRAVNDGDGYTPRVAVALPTLAPLRRLKKLFGGTVSSFTDRAKGRKRIWQWRVEGAEARAVLAAVEGQLYMRGARAKQVVVYGTQEEKKPSLWARFVEWLSGAEN